MEKILDFLSKVVDKYGTKFLVALGGVAAVGYLIYVDKIPGMVGAIVMGAIVLVYFIFRHQQEKNGGTK